MNEEKFIIKRNTIEETLVIPLYVRKKCTELYPSLFRDEKAGELINRIDYSFDELEDNNSSFAKRFGALEIAMRHNNLAIEIKEYLDLHPHASIVNLGCGLDQTAECCDNGKCKIYNIDLPDVISVRNQLIPAKERVKNIPCNLNDTAWFDKVDNFNGIIFFASDVFYYFKKDELRSLINKMAENFKGGRLVFDTCNKKGLKLMLKKVVQKNRMDNVNGYFHVDSMEKDVSPWLKRSCASKKGYMTGYDGLKDKSIPFAFKMLSMFGDNNYNMQILRLDFYK